VARRLLEDGPASHIIFVTAFDQHAIEAFEVNAIDYLLKPVDPARLEIALQRARRRISSDRQLAGEAGSSIAADQLEKIVQLVTERQNRRERLAIKVGERFLLVQAEEILYASLADESITVVTGNTRGRPTIGRWTSSRHGSTRRLLAGARSHLVNINKIKEIVLGSVGTHPENEDEKATEIPVSRTQTRRCREYLKL
jgi:DNA-binding LytR/AlgR family response regulator